MASYIVCSKLSYTINYNIFKELCVGGSKGNQLVLYSPYSTRNVSGVLYCNIPYSKKTLAVKSLVNKDCRKFGGKALAN